MSEPQIIFPTMPTPPPNAADIEKAMRTAYFAAIPGVGPLTAFENQPFDPAGKIKWYKFHFLPNVPEVASLGADGQDAHSGICQVDIMVGKGAGKGGSDTDIEKLRSAFTPGKRLVYSSANVIVRGCGRIPGGETETSYRFSVSIPWECRLSRS